MIQIYNRPMKDVYMYIEVQCDLKHILADLTLCVKCRMVGMILHCGILIP